MTILARLADRVIGVPLLLHPAKAEVLLAVLGGRIAVDMALPDDLADLSPEASRFIGSQRRPDGGYRLTRAAGGVGIVTVAGGLVNRGAWIDARSGLVSYEGIDAQMSDADRDPDVKAVVLDLSTPGGEAAGMFGTAAKIRDVAQRKPVIAFVNDMAMSAGYGLASACTEIVISPTSSVGHIGSILMHLDRTTEMNQKGIKPTLVFNQKHKPDGHPLQTMTPDIHAELLRIVTAFDERFFETVGLGRPALGAAGAKATEARIYIGAEAIKAGLADRIATLDETLAALAQGKGPRRRTTTGGPSMTNEQRVAAITGAPEAKGRESLAAHLANNTTLSAEDAIATLKTTPVAAAAPPTPPTPPTPPALPAGQQDAGATRIKTILNAPEAKGREAMAQHLALNTEMSAADAIATLKVSPAASAAAGYEQRKEDAGALGLGNHTPPAKTGAASWSSSVAKVNARVSDPAARTGV
jgi:ClpP class serine protease